VDVPRFSAVPFAVTVPSMVVVVAEAAEPTLIAVVLPATPFWPMDTVLVVAVRVAPDAIEVVDAAVELPKTSVGPEKVLLPE
jgi:hypothetical protein